MIKQMMDIHEQRELIDIDPLLIQFIEHPDPLIISEAISRSPEAILSIEAPSFMDVRDVARKQPALLKKMNDQSLPEQFVLKLLDNPTTKGIYEYLPYQTKAIQSFMVRMNEKTFPFLSHPPDDVLLEYYWRYPKQIAEHDPKKDLLEQLIIKDPEYIAFIKNPTAKLQVLAYKNGITMLPSFFESLLKTAKKEIILQEGRFFNWLPEEEKTEEMAYLAIKSKEKNYHALEFIEQVPKSIQIEALAEASYFIKYIKNPDLEVQQIAFDRNIDVFGEIDQPHLSLMEAYFKKKTIRSLKEFTLSKNVQLYAITKNVNAVKYITNPCTEVQMEVVNKDVTLLASIRPEWRRDVAMLEAIKKDKEFVKELGELPVICKLYLAFTGELPHKHYLLFFLQRCLESLKEKPMKQVELPIFSLLAESVYLLPTSKEKKEWLMYFSLEGLNEEQKQFMKELDEYYSR